MPLRSSPTSSWLQRTDRPSRVVGTGDEGYRLYEDEGTFLLEVELPGYDVEDIDVRWMDGTVTVSAEHVDEARERKRTFHRRFRLPKEIVDEEIAARYENGVLTVEMPTLAGASTTGTKIDVEH